MSLRPIFASIVLATFAMNCVAQTAATGAIEEIAAAQDGEVVNDVPIDFFAYSDQGHLRIQLILLDGMSKSRMDNIKVHLFSFDGESKKSSVNAEHRVHFDGVEPGPYGAVISGPNIYAAVALYVKEREDSKPISPLNIPVIPVRNDLEIRNFASYIPYPTPHYDYHDHPEFEPTKTRSKNYYHAQLNPQGVMRGRVYAIANQGQDLDRNRTEVAIYKDGQIVQRVIPDRKGWFSVQNLKPGIYCVNTTSWLGYSAFCFELVANNTADINLVSTSMRTAKQADGIPLEILLIPRNILPFVEETIEDDVTERTNRNPTTGTPVSGGVPMAGSPVGPGGAPGGPGAGGGGPGGGGGGVGGGGSAAAGTGGAELAAVAGVAALAAAATDNDNDRGVPIVAPSEASPNMANAVFANQ